MASILRKPNRADQFQSLDPSTRRGALQLSGEISTGIDKGFGIVPVAEDVACADIAFGNLVRVLPDFDPLPQPMHILYLQRDHPWELCQPGALTPPIMTASHWNSHLSQLSGQVRTSPGASSAWTR
jgi:hypothetical protein